MKRKYKEQSVRERKQSVISNHKVIWDKPLTTSLVTSIINSIKLSHWSIVYNFWFENGPEGDFGTQTWVDLEAHDMGWLWSSARDEAKEKGYSHKDYHKNVQQRLADEVKQQLLPIVALDTIPRTNRPSKSWRKSESKNKYRVSRIVTFNSKSLPTTGYYIYRIDVTDVSTDVLVVI